MTISVKHLLYFAFSAVVIAALIVINLNQLSLTKAGNHPISAPITSPEVTPEPTQAPQDNHNHDNGGSSNVGGSNGGSSSGPSVCGDQKPATPVLLSATKITPTQVRLTWSKPVGPVTGYTLAFGLTPTKMLYGVPNTGNTNSFVVNQLQSRSTYYFQVRALNNCTPGELSNTVGITGAGKVLGAKAVAAKTVVNTPVKSAVKTNVAPKASTTVAQPSAAPVVQEVKVENKPQQNFFDNFVYSAIRFLYR